jgi:hypothetical protein
MIDPLSGKGPNSAGIGGMGGLNDPGKPPALRPREPDPQGLRDRFEAPERARAEALVRLIAAAPQTRTEKIAAARRQLESGFFHTEKGARAIAESLLGAEADRAGI